MTALPRKSSSAGSGTRPLLLDLFCGAGGCSMGYHRAGFDVIGVDIRPQPRYPFEFVEMDALVAMESLLERGLNAPVGFQGCGSYLLSDFDAIHASPPCQAHSHMGKRWPDREHPDLIPATREALCAAGLPYIIENVVGAPLINPVQLCGSALGLPVKRHRLFETSFPLMAAGCAHGMHEKRYRIRQHGREMDTAFCYVFGGGQAGQPVAAWREAMGIDWMTVDELSQAIPPAYTEHIGGYLMAAVSGTATTGLTA